jgi:predicted nucleic-acid-binding protein
MSDEMTDQELAIVSAIAAEIVEVLQRDVSLAVEIVEDRLQLLVDAELINVDEDSCVVRTILHVALDAVLDAIAEGDDEELEDEDEDSYELDEEDEDEDER